MQSITSLPTQPASKAFDIEYLYKVNPVDTIIGTQDMTVDKNGKIYMALLLGSGSNELVKLNADYSVNWSVTTSTFVLP